MAKGNVKLAYISGQFRIKAQITKALTRAIATPPDDIFLRAQKKMSAIKREGEIDLFSVYKSKFLELWKACQDHPSLDEHETLTFTLAEGSPALNGLRLTEATEQHKAIASLSIAASPVELQGWRIEWIQYFVNHQLKLLGLTQQANPAQVHGAWLKAMSGEQVSDLPLAAHPGRPDPGEIQKKPYSIIANKARKEVTLVIRNITYVVEQIGITKIIDLIRDASEKVSEQFGGTYQVLRKETTLGIQQALNGPEILGINTPLILLAATGCPKAVTPSAPPTPVKTDYRGAGKLQIIVSPDAMEASVTNFSTGLYRSKEFTMTDDWLKNEIARHGIDPELSKPYLKDLTTAIVGKESLENMLVAVGRKSQGGSKPYLHSNYRENQAEPETKNTDNVVDIRDLQQKAFVKTDQLVASLRYQNSPKKGKNVYGEDLEPAKDADLFVEVGDGIEEKSPGKYFATFDGVPVIGKASIALTKMMIHQGDVNLRSGNITFDGPVEVTGSIDTGSYVQVSGDLKVKGSIRNALVRVGGDLEVNNGIVTGRKGLVFVAGDIRAEFMENSTLQCGGSLFVRKAILNCNIISGGKIEILNKESGLIAGGMISCRQNMYTANLGFKNGNVTELNTGVDWRTELSVRIRTQRIEKVQEVANKDRQSLREVMQRKKNQMTEKHEARKRYFQERLVKSRELIEKMKQHLEYARAQLVFDQDVKVFIKETIYANVKIHVGGTPVTVSQDTAGVAILGKRKRGTKIVPIETALQMEQDEDEAM